MTVLGKILVIVNLVFSLVTGALIVMVFVTRTNWHTQYDRRVAELNAARQEAANYREEAAAATRAANKEIGDLKDTIKQQSDQITSLQTQTKGLATTVTDKDKTVTATGATSVQATEETARLRTEVQKLQDDLGKRDKKVDELEKQMKDLNDQKILAEIAYDSEHRRLKETLDQVASLTEELGKARTRGGATTSTSGYPTEAAVRPAPADLHGKVLAVDDKSGLVTINAGSDNGLTRGNTLEVFRLAPKPTYLGTIRIMAINPHQAVGRPVGGLRPGAIQKGDEVASNILGAQ